LQVVFRDLSDSWVKRGDDGVMAPADMKAAAFCRAWPEYPSGSAGFVHCAGRPALELLGEKRNGDKERMA
jgi:hypothetical protein